MLVTSDELELYEEATAERLERTLEDYGLICCGWSGDWDPALRKAIMAARARRYPLQFCHVRPPSESVIELLANRQGTAIKIADADKFFVELAEKLDALEATKRRHPHDVATFVGRVKRLMSDPSRLIDLDDLVTTETNRVFSELSNDELFPSALPRQNNNDTYRQLATIANRHVNTVEPLCFAIAVGAGHAAKEQEPLWQRSVERLAAAKERDASVLGKLRHLLALPVIYAAAIAAIHRSNFSFLRSVVIDANCRLESGPTPLVVAVKPWNPFSNEILPRLLAYEAQGQSFDDEALTQLASGTSGRLHTPVSDWLHEVCRAPVDALIPDAEDYSETFDRAEAFLALLGADAKLQLENSGRNYVRDPYIGRFVWRRRHLDTASHEVELVAEGAANGQQWGPIQAGMFGGDLGRLEAASEALIELVAERRRKIPW